MDSNRYDIERIRKYLNGELSPQEMFVLERQAQDDPVLMDLLEGMEMAGNDPVHQANIRDIRNQIPGMAGEVDKIRKMPVPWRKWAVAASIILVAGIGAFFVWRPSSNVGVELVQQLETGPSPRGQEAEREATSQAESAESASVVPSQSAAPAPAQQVPPRAAVGRDAGGLAEDQLAATPPPRALSALRPADSLSMSASAGAQAGAAAASAAGSGTVLLAARQEAADTNEKRLSMTIRSLPADTVGRPMYRTISGVVRQLETGQPIAGVTISGSDANVATQSAMDGKFSLAIPVQNDSLTIASLGFEKQTLDVRNRDSLVVVLEESLAELSEVVVVGYGQASRRGERPIVGAVAVDAGQPKPISGWVNFEQYIQRETASSQGKGTVTLKFRVGDKGQPVDVQLEHTTNPSVVRRAMEILQVGPRWERGAAGDVPATVLIEFR